MFNRVGWVIVFEELLLLHLISGNNVDTHLDLYTDLVDMIGVNNSCVAASDVRADGNASTMTTEKSDLIIPHKITLSRPEFHEQNRVDAAVGRCEPADLLSYRFENATWSCCTESDSINWIFVNCAEQTLHALHCLELQYADDLLKKTCDERSLRRQCLEFPSVDGNGVWCSKNFFAETIITEREITAPGAPVITMEIAAYLCAAFILVAFILAIAIPESKCRPSYRYDKENKLRVPLAIYEMCGETYKPSAKKRRLSKNMISNERSRRLYAHFRNLSIAASTSRTAIKEESKSSKQENALWENEETRTTLKEDLVKRINGSELFNGTTCTSKNTLSNDCIEAANGNNELHRKSDATECSNKESEAGLSKRADNEGYQFDESCKIEDDDEVFFNLPMVARPEIMSSNLNMHSEDACTKDFDSSTHTGDSNYRFAESGNESSIDTYRDQYRKTLIYKTKITNIFPRATKIPNIGYPMPFLTLKNYTFSSKYRASTTYDVSFENPFDYKDFLDCSTIAKRSNQKRPLNLYDCLEYKATANNNELLYEHETRDKSRRFGRNMKDDDSHDLGKQPNRDVSNNMADENGMNSARGNTKGLDLLSEIKRHYRNKRMLSRISEHVDESLIESENDITTCRSCRRASIC